MIAFSSLDYDLSGHFYFKNGDIDTSMQLHRDIVRRVSRTKTLDGGVYISDSGVSVGDKMANFVSMKMASGDITLLFYVKESA